MTLSTRYGLVGLGGLALLTGGHWVREVSSDGALALVYILGVLPNIAAAIAIPFVFMGIFADQQKDASVRSIRNWFFASVFVSCASLFAWEFIQLGGDRLVFDTDDLIASLFGSVISLGIFAAVTKRP